MDTEKAKNAKALLVARLGNPRIRARIANARLAIERAGGVNNVAEILGYANASYLSQIFGPNPTLAYEESAEHAGRPSESKLRQVVRLLK